MPDLSNDEFVCSLSGFENSNLFRISRPIFDVSKHMRIVDLKIKDVAFGGKGVAREQGKAVFIPYTIEGEMVSAEIVREKKQFCRSRAGRS